MSFDNDGLNYTIEASADLSADQFRAVIIVAGGAEIAGADAVIAGVLQNDPEAIGQAANVRSKGVSKAQVGAAVARGATLATDANGDFITTATAADIVAIALEAGSGAGSIVSVLLL